MTSAYRAGAQRTDRAPAEVIVMRSHGRAFLAAFAVTGALMIAVGAWVALARIHWTAVAPPMGLGAFTLLAVAWYAQTGRVLVDHGADEIIVVRRGLLRRSAERFALAQIREVRVRAIEEAALERLVFVVASREVVVFEGLPGDVGRACTAIERALAARGSP